MKSRYDIAIIGAGPAGMAAAITASQHGASVVLLDEQPAAGGQIYRGVAAQRLADRGILGPEYYEGLELVERFASCAAEHITGATVWQVSRDREIGVSIDGHASQLCADQIIIATGAMERPFPVPGWTLPGVMGAGAAQVLLKTGGTVFPDAVFVGTGPLLYLVAHQYLRAGVAIKAILDTTERGNLLRALPHLPAALPRIGTLIKGRRWIGELRSAGIPFVRGVRGICLAGDDTVEVVEYTCQTGPAVRIETGRVLLHQGVVPNANLAMAAGCAYFWNPSQLCWHARVDNWFESDNRAGIAIAGDGAAINGAVAARQSGEVAALGALYRCGIIPEQQRDKIARPLRKALASETRIRRFLDTLFTPSEMLRVPGDGGTIVCRCEEVTASQIRAAARLGCGDTNQLKSYTRCGMGPCQGRFCTLSAAEIIAGETGVPISEMAPPRQRMPAKPLSLDELSKLASVLAPEH